MCGSASTFAKIALAVLVVAFILQIVAIATDYWMTKETTIDLEEVNVGLWRWKTCPLGTSCSDGDVPDSYDSDKFKVTQAFECMVLILLLVPIVVLSIYLINERFRDMTVALFICIMCFVIVMFGIIGMAVWLTQMPTNFYANFSLGLAVLAFVFAFLAAILMIPDIRNYNEQRKRKPMKVAPKTDYSYNKRYSNKFDSNVRHYYNPNREPYMTRSPPPTYRSLPGASDRKYTGHVGGPRADVSSPDIFLGGAQRY